LANDAIGDRMKGQYENRTRIFLPRRTYTILRVDGKAFHSYCAKMERPYDVKFMGAMDVTAATMLKELMGAEFAYIQSDEISFLLTDFAKTSTEAWFDGNVQKMASVGASMATAVFSAQMGCGLPMFDARVFTIPDYVEVENYFVWRQQDAVRNSILMLAQHYYSPKEMHGKNCSVLQDMIHDKGDNWNNHPTRFKRGGFVWYNRETLPYPSWEIDDAPNFTGEEERPKFAALIPKHGY
jgi:tRNA(His) 5'-end guanylyltransferase